MRIFIKIIVTFVLITGVSKAQYTIDSIYDFKLSFNDSALIFFRAINRVDDKILVSFSHDASENFVFTSDYQNINFQVAAKDTSPYKWLNDEFGHSTKIYDSENRSAALRSVCLAGDDILIARGKGIISRINYNKKIFDNDTVSKNLIPFFSIESSYNLIAATTDSSIYLSEDFGYTWTDFSPKLTDLGYDTNNYYMLNRKAVFLNYSEIILWSVIYNMNGTRHENSFFKTTDKGKTWQKLFVIGNQKGIVNDFCITNDGNFFVCGYRDIFIKNIERIYEWLSVSNDGGISWTDKISDSAKVSLSLGRVKFYNEYFGITYGANYLHYTFDGGDNWNVFFATEILNMSISAIEFAGRNSLLIGGARVGILKKITFNGVGVDDKIHTEDYKISPNPASDFIRIQTSAVLKNSDVCKMQIFNTFGIEFRNIAQPQSIAGEGIRIDISDLQPGVYYIKLGDKVAKFVKI